ncbi:thiamine pyrophosphate-dependent enzyme [Vibrio vulnificus]|uniref:thiamine pyrophosphate-dependent enzyme n=1 Tax=Vibrio vulnificus TaxID=672 RepID=UPI0039B3C490
MNIQELALIRIENLPVKVMVLNNQHLGMVVQWEDRFYKANRAHTYLGNPECESEIYPAIQHPTPEMRLKSVRS